MNNLTEQEKKFADTFVYLFSTHTLYMPVWVQKLHGLPGMMCLMT